MTKMMKNFQMKKVILKMKFITKMLQTDKLHFQNTVETKKVTNCLIIRSFRQFNNFILKAKTTSPCSDCKAICSLKMIHILSKDKKSKASQGDILNELKLHGHPQSRIMPNQKQRVRDEAAEELASHYEYFHNKKRPRLE